MKGFTLIEFMIAMTIGFLILSGILSLFINTSNSYKLQSAYSQLQENGRFISGYLPAIIRLSGYRSPPTQVPFLSLSTIFNDQMPYVSGTYNLSGSDTLTIRYQGSGDGHGVADGTILDCLENGVDANTIVTNTFSLTSKNELQCESHNPNINPSDNTQIILSGVENFKILFGEDLNNDNIPDRYVNASFPTLNMNRVVSIRMSFLIRSDNTTNVTASGTKTYNLLGTLYTPNNRNYLRQQITSTILLQNTISDMSGEST